MKQSMSDTERKIAANMLSRIGRVLKAHAPERVVKAHARLVELLMLPQPDWQSSDREKWQPFRETPRASERLSEDEVHILNEWLETVVALYNGRVPAPAIDAHLKLARMVEGLATRPIATAVWWKAFDKEHGR